MRRRRERAALEPAVQRREARRIAAAALRLLRGLRRAADRRALRRRSVAAAAGEAPAPAVTAAGRALAGLAHVQGAALQVLAVELGDRLLRLARRAHLDEAEATRLSRGAIGDDRDGLARPGLGEQCLQVLARGVEGKVADEDLLAHLFSLLAPRGGLGFCRGCLGEKPTSERGGVAHKQEDAAGLSPIPGVMQTRLT